MQFVVEIRINPFEWCQIDIIWEGVIDILFRMRLQSQEIKLMLVSERWRKTVNMEESECPVGQTWAKSCKQICILQWPRTHYVSVSDKFARTFKTQKEWVSDKKTVKTNREEEIRSALEGIKRQRQRMTAQLLKSVSHCGSTDGDWWFGCAHARGQTVFKGEILTEFKLCNL